MITISVHRGGVTTTQTFDSGVVLIGSDIQCMVRVLGLDSVAAELALRDGRWIVTDRATGVARDQPLRLVLEGVKIDFSY